jgi:hypothetical protein
VVSFPDVGRANFHLCVSDNPHRGIPLRGGRAARTKSSPSHHLQVRDHRGSGSRNRQSIVARRGARDDGYGSLKIVQSLRGAAGEKAGAGVDKDVVAIADAAGAARAGK